MGVTEIKAWADDAGKPHRTKLEAMRSNAIKALGRVKRADGCNISSNTMSEIMDTGCGEHIYRILRVLYGPGAEVDDE